MAGKLPVSLMAGKLPVSRSAGKPPVRVDGRTGRSPNSWAGVGAVGEDPMDPRVGSDLGSGAAVRVLGEVGPQERAVEHVNRVRLPDQALGLVGAVRRLDAPQVHPDAERLGRLDRGHHVLVARDQHRVGDGPVPGQRLHVRPDLGVHALLLAARVQVAEPELDPGHLGDDPLVDGRHPVPGGVVPVDPEQLAADDLVGVLGDHLDQRDGVDPEIAPRARTEQQFTRGRVDIADVHHDRVAGQDG